MKAISFVFSCLLALNAFGQQDLNYALKLVNSEQYEEAEKVLGGLIEKEPSNGNLYYYYGEALLKDYLSDTFSNSLEEFARQAEELFQKGLQNAPANGLNLVGMGALVLLRTSDTTQAQDYFNKAEATIPLKKKQIKPDHAVLLTKMAEAQLYSDVINYKRAFGYITKATTIDNTNPQTPLVLGDIYMTQNNASEALRAYNRAAFLDPTWPVPKIKIGDIYMRVPALNQARPLFEEARDIDSTFAPVYRSLGELYYKAGMYELSNQNFEKFIEMSGNTTPAKLRYANSMFKAGNFSGALTVYEDILQVDKSRNYIYRTAAYSAYDVKPPQLEKAKQYIETFLANEDPANVIWRDYAYYGRILYKMANFSDSALMSKSFTQFMKAYEMDSANLPLVNELAMNFYNGKWYEGAIKMLNRKAELSENGLSVQDLQLLGTSYYQMDQLNDAEKVFAEIIAKEPDNITGYIFMARTYAKMETQTGNIGIAEPKFQEVIDKFASLSDKKNEISEAYGYMISLYTQKRSSSNMRNWAARLKSLDPQNKGWVIKSLQAEALSWIYQANPEGKDETPYVNARSAYQELYTLDPAPVTKQTIDDLTKTINYIRNSR